jgi:hypothetical protein
MGAVSLWSLSTSRRDFEGSPRGGGGGGDRGALLELLLAEGGWLGSVGRSMAYG